MATPVKTSACEAAFRRILSIAAITLNWLSGHVQCPLVHRKCRQLPPTATALRPVLSRQTLAGMGLRRIWIRQSLNWRLSTAPAKAALMVSRYGGLRHLQVDFDAGITPVNPLIPAHSAGGDESYSDFMLGARYATAFSDRWGMTLSGDGSWGDTEGTWNASVLFNCRVSMGAWIFGWRHMEIELQPNEQSVDLALDGPIAGSGFKF